MPQTWGFLEPGVSSESFQENTRLKPFWCVAETLLPCKMTRNYLGCSCDVTLLPVLVRTAIKVRTGIIYLKTRLESTIECKQHTQPDKVLSWAPAAKHHQWDALRFYPIILSLKWWPSSHWLLVIRREAPLWKTALAKVISLLLQQMVNKWKSWCGNVAMCFSAATKVPQTWLRWGQCSPFFSISFDAQNALLLQECAVPMALTQTLQSYSGLCLGNVGAGVRGAGWWFHVDAVVLDFGQCFRVVQVSLGPKRQGWTKAVQNNSRPKRSEWGTVSTRGMNFACT